MGLLPNLSELLAEATARHGVPGAAVAVGLGDELVEAASGVLNRNTGVEATPDSVFQIGSVTKVWTAALVLQLVDEGAVDLDSPVRTYLPEFAVVDAGATESVTVRQLLAHTGGFDGDLFEDTGRGDHALERYVAYLRGAAGQVHAPGALFSYCNSGYCVLGALVARLRCGGTWEQVMRDRLFGPLGATHVALLAEEAIMFRAAAGHIGGPDGLAVVPQWQMPRSGAPAGATMCAAPRELVRFGRAFLRGGDDGLLSADAVAAMREPQVPVPGLAGWGAASWGLGLELFDWSGTAAIGHGGGTPGQSTVWRVVPEHGLVVAMNANGPGAAALFEDILVPVAREAAGVVVPLLPRPPAVPVAAGDVTPFLGRYAGPLTEYEVAAARGGLDITVKPGEFMTRIGMRRKTDRYVRVSGDAFLAAEPEDGYHYQVTFVDNGRYLHTGRAVPRV